MFINGISYAGKSLGDALAGVKALNSGFIVRTHRRTDDAHYSKSEAHGLANEGSVLLSRWQEAKPSWLLEKANDYYDRSLISAEVSKNNLIRAITYARYAEAAPLFGKEVTLPFRLLSTAVELCKECDAKDFASQFANKLHEALYRVVRNSIEHGVSSDVLEPWLEMLRDVRRNASKQFRNQRGEPIDTEAYRVEQGEVGYTNDQRIGTDFLAQCISPIIHNPYTKMTALAHIDYGVDVNSLDDVLVRLGYDHSGQSLLVRLVGGNNADTGSHEASNQRMNSIATSNVARILEYLQKKNINIVSSDILEGEQPSSVVVDPRYFSLHEAVPGKENPDFFLAQGRAMLYGEGKPLFEAFDLSQSIERLPIYIDQRLVQVLHPLFRLPIEQLYDMCTKSEGLVDSIVGEQVEGVKCLASEFRKVSEMGIGQLSARLDELQEQGYVFDDVSLQRTVKVVSGLPVFVGNQSERVNLPLLSFLRHDFIRVINNGDNLFVDARGLKHFSQFSTDTGMGGPR